MIISYSCTHKSIKRHFITKVIQIFCRARNKNFHYGQYLSLPLSISSSSLPYSIFLPSLSSPPSLSSLFLSPESQPLSAAKGSGEALKFLKRVRAEPGRQMGFGVFSAKKRALLVISIKYLMITEITT